MQHLLYWKERAHKPSREKIVVREEGNDDEHIDTPPKPRGLRKWAYRLSRYLYGWHLGWLLGHHIMMITHIGRKTGIVRQTVVEAMNYDPKTQACQAFTGWGEQTDWYRNLQAHPAL